jgi:hypothetical protein
MLYEKSLVNAGISSLRESIFFYNIKMGNCTNKPEAK